MKWIYDASLKSPFQGSDFDIKFYPAMIIKQEIQSPPEIIPLFWKYAEILENYDLCIESI